jgi:hypothetical protein
MDNTANISPVLLVAADAGASDEAITSGVSVGGSTVYRTKRRFVEGNLKLAVSEEARSGAPRGCDSLLQPAAGAQALDTRLAGRRDGQTNALRRRGPGSRGAG